jgi:hypothetical protein
VARPRTTRTARLLVAAAVAAGLPACGLAAETRGSGTTAAAGAEDVIAVMDGLFDAMRSRDTAAIRALAHPELRLFVPITGADGPAIRVATLDEFIHSVAASPALLDERAFRPEVRIDGELATIWTYYEFRRGDAFSHCGYDAFHFARDTGGWKIVGLAYTIRQQDCLDEWQQR